MLMDKARGALVISLDFELFWGVADIADFKEWDDRIKRVYEIVPRTLKLFEKYGIHATWATVAGIMMDNENELTAYLPKELPLQTREIIERFHFKDVNNTIPHYMLFGNELVKMIKNTDGQEIGTHTFTHYYCNKEDSSSTNLNYELETASRIMREKGYGVCKTVVFPRNQVKSNFVSNMPKNIKNYRGVKQSYVNKLKSKKNALGNIVWYADHYIPLQNSTISYCEINERGLFNVKLSRLFKAYKEKYRILEGIKMIRYKNEMKYAAKHNRIYHICWHPHNFSDYIEKNFEQLEILLEEFDALRNKYGMCSYNMNECAEISRQL